MNLGNDELGALKQFLYRELVYFQTWTGITLDVNDELERGRIKVKIPELGWTTPNKCPWVEPEILYGQVTPLKDVAVLVYFVNGDMSKPMYRGRTGDLKVSRLQSYEGPDTVVLFEDDGEDPLTVLYRRDKQELEVVMGAEGEGFSQVISVEDKTVITTLGNVTVTVDGAAGSVEAVVGDKSTVLIEDGKMSAEFDKCSLETDGSKWTVDAGGNAIELTDSKATIADNLEVSK